MSDRQPPRQVQRKLGDVDADGNWQLGSPAPASATDDKTQTRTRRWAVLAHHPRAPPLRPAAAQAGGDEDSDKDDGLDSGSSPSVDD